MMRGGGDGAPFFCLAAAFRQRPKGRHRVTAIYHDYLRLVPDSTPAHGLTPRHWKNCVRGVAQNPKGLIRNYARLTPPVGNAGEKSPCSLDCCPLEACSWHQSVSDDSMRRHKSVISLLMIAACWKTSRIRPINFDKFRRGGKVLQLFSSCCSIESTN